MFRINVLKHMGAVHQSTYFSIELWKHLPGPHSEAMSPNHKPRCPATFLCQLPSPVQPTLEPGCPTPPKASIICTCTYIFHIIHCSHCLSPYFPAISLHICTIIHQYTRNVIMHMCTGIDNLTNELKSYGGVTHALVWSQGR